MSDVSRLFPVSAVGHAWLVDTFAAKFTAVPQGSVVWLGADDIEDAEYVMTQMLMIAAFGPCGRVSAYPEDPSLLLMDLLGSPEAEGLVPMQHPLKSIMVFCGRFLSERSLDRISAGLRAISLAFRTRMVVPVPNRLTVQNPEFMEEDCVLNVPAFVECSQKAQLDVAKILLEDALRETTAALPVGGAEDLLRTGPRSRGELAATIRRQISGAGEHSFRPAHVVNDAIWRTDFVVLYGGVGHVLDSINAGFERWIGRPLFGVVRSESEPFDFGGPHSWFHAVVSSLSNVVFDSPDPCFQVLQRYMVQGGVVVSCAPNPFYGDLRALRTRYQHGLDWSKSSDRATRDTVRSWFSRACGVARAERQHWRVALQCLLKDCDTALRRLKDVVEVAPSDLQRESIERQIAEGSRSLRRDDWRRLLDAAVAELAPRLESSAIWDRRGSDMQKMLRTSRVAQVALQEEAGKIVRHVVADELAVPPVEPADLACAGYSGRSLGYAWKYAQEVSAERPTLSKEGLLELVSIKYPQLKL